MPLIEGMDHTDYNRNAVAGMIKAFYGEEIGQDGILRELSSMDGTFRHNSRNIELLGDTRDLTIFVKKNLEINFFRIGLQPPLAWDRINRGWFEDSPGIITRHIDIDDYPTRFIYGTENMQNQMLRGYSLNLTSDIVKIVKEKTDLRDRQPYNISLDSFEDDNNSHAMFFRYGSDTVMSIYSDADGVLQVSRLKATAPICAGEGRRVIYTYSRVYENSIDLKGVEKELCHSLSSRYEKNWGCFGREGAGPLDKYFIVYSVFPLRIFEVRNGVLCVEVQSVLRDYPNFDRIEKVWVDERDSRATSIFRGGSRGIQFGGEYLFVGHVTPSDNTCFPHWFVQKNADDHDAYSRMYFMFFYTIKYANGSFSVSRISSCFQPPSNGKFHKVIFPVGIARMSTSDEIVVSFGRDDTDCPTTI